MLPQNWDPSDELKSESAIEKFLLVLKIFFPITSSRHLLFEFHFHVCLLIPGMAEKGPNKPFREISHLVKATIDANVMQKALRWTSY